MRGVGAAWGRRQRAMLSKLKRLAGGAADGGLPTRRLSRNAPANTSKLD